MATDLSTHEQTVLFGLLAVKLGKVDEAQWSAAAAATLTALPSDDKTVEMGPRKNVGEILIETGTITAHDAVTIQGMAAEAVRANGGDVLKAINSLAKDSDTVQTLASGLFADPRDAATFVANAGFDPSAATVALDRSSADAKTFATDSSYAKTLATDSSYAQTIASNPGGDLSHAQTVMSDRKDPGAAPTVMGQAPPGTVGGKPKRSMDDTLPAVPEHEGRYEFVKALSQGGMGQIVIVHDQHLGRDVALKTLLPDRVPGGTRSRTRTGAPSMQILTVPIIARFLQEARIAGQLEHPGIAPAYELGYKPDGTIYYTMQLVKGNDLQSHLKNCKTLADRLKYLPNFLDVCNAIAFAHSRGVIHRDLKPLNVMIGEFGETLTIDWGIAKIKGVQDIHASDVVERANQFRMGDTQSTAKTTYGQAMGSPYYMPPEQAAGKVDEVDERADIYALGAILYVFLTGNPPYKEMKVLEFLDKVQSFDPRPIKEQEPEAPAELIAICQRAMARKREDRYKTAKELRDEVDKYIQGGLVGAYKYSFGELFKRWVKRHWKILSTAAAGLLAFTVLAVFSYFAVRAQRDEAVFQRGRAEEKEQQAIAEKEHAETELYFSNTALAQRSIDAAQMAAARKLLETAPAQHRNWEWGHFEQLANADQMSLEIGGQYVALGPNNTIITGNDRGTLSVVDAKTGESKAQLIKTAGYGYAFAASADGKRVAMNGPTGVFVWELETQKQVFNQAHTLEEGRRFGFGLTLSADGSKVAANEPDNMARVWDVATGKMLVEAPADLGGVFINPAGTQAIVAHVDRDQKASYITLFDLAIGAAQKKLDVSDAGTVKDAVFSPDGGHLAVAMDAALLLFETAQWKQIIPPLGVSFAKSGTLKFSRDGGLLFAGTKTGSVVVVPLAKPENTLQAEVSHTADVRTMALAEDAGLLFTASGDRTIHEYTIPNLELVRVIRGHDSAVFDVTVDATATIMASASPDGITKLWDLRADLERYYDHDVNTTQATVFAPETGMLAIAVPQGVILADAATQVTKRLLPVKDGEVKLLAWDPAGTRLAVYRQTGPGGAVTVHDTMAEGATLKEFATKGHLTRLGIAGNGAAVVIEGDDGIRMIDVASGTATPLEGVALWQLAPKGDLLALAKAGADGKSEHISLVQVPAMTEVGALDAPAKSKLLWSADGTKFYVGSAKSDGKETKGVLLRWDVAAKKALPELAGHGQVISAVADAGDVLATGSGDFLASIILWDAASGQPRATMSGHAGPVTCLAFSPDKTRLVSGSTDGTFKLWDARDGRAIATIQSNPVLAAETTLELTGYAAFTPDGLTVATISDPPLPPVALHALPWDPAKLGGSDHDPLQARIEAFKRK